VISLEIVATLLLVTRYLATEFADAWPVTATRPIWPPCSGLAAAPQRR